jgi:hypothetical protein
MRVYACARRRCSTPECIRHALNERTAIARPLIMDNFPGHWGILVLPYSPECRARLRISTLLKGARQLVASRMEGVILDMNGLDQDDGWRLGIISVDHPEGDKVPDKWLPHHNFLFPCFAFHPEHGRREIRYCFTRAELLELREEWRELQEIILEAPLIRRDNAGNFYRVEADFKYEWLPPATDAKTLKQRLHAVNYFPRTFPHWSSNGQRLSYMGAFGCSRIHQLPGAMALKTQVREAKESQKLCRTCRGPVVKRTYESGHVPLHYRAVFIGPAP